MKVGSPGLAVLAAAQQAQAQQARAAPDLSDTGAAQAAVGRRGPERAPGAQAAEKQQDGTGNDAARQRSAGSGTTARPANEKGADGLTPAEERQVRALQQRDAEVRRHEQAHAAAGGAYAGAPQYQYVTGPDGRRYAVSGEVSISTGAVGGNPQATITKLQAVKRAALAPTNPSPQDRRVAAQADLGIAQARIELREERAEEARERREEEGAGTDPASTDDVEATAATQAAGTVPSPADGTPRPAQPVEPGVLLNLVV